jgi:hypothetical protein
LKTVQPRLEKDRFKLVKKTNESLSWHSELPSRFLVQN